MIMSYYKDNGYNLQFLNSQLVLEEYPQENYLVIYIKSNLGDLMEAKLLNIKI